MKRLKKVGYLWINFRRRILQQRLIVIVGTAHKVGSTWLFGMIKDLGYLSEGLNLIPSKYQSTGTILLEDVQVFKYLQELSGFLIFKSHSYPPQEHLVKGVKFITILRDPRDVIVSSIFYLANLTEENGGWGREFREASEVERIKTLIKKGDFLLSRLEQWSQTRIAYKVMFENLKERPLEEIKGILDYLKISATEKSIEYILERHSFKSKSARKVGLEDKTSFYRKGVSGDWKNYFDHDCIQLFKSEKNGRWNHLLLEMGYERTFDW